MHKTIAKSVSLTSILVLSAGLFLSCSNPQNFDSTDESRALIYKSTKHKSDKSKSKGFEISFIPFNELLHL